MTGWEKVGALTALYAVGMLWANYAMLRRVKGAVAERAAWTAADFDAVFAGADADPRVAPAVRAALALWYGEGVVPQPEDTLKRFLKMARGDVEDVANAAAAALSLPADPLVPDLPDVAALVRYLDGRVGAAPQIRAS
ncbi:MULTISPECIES: hypothetical protein [Sphingomonas]|uniref:Uncharacterized protein n=1 Tax=Sphingomonas adhaesiva TaxID=28212 RepID=A0A2A4I8G7_9SPHN|nr:MULTISPECIES: hypothetical protein [Sphingomonas]PCG14294.1 hypothetical protein COA07_10965 [Sphingomonas adhaesiva]PZU80632.1 MAG: hypothetical protein DI530_04985 [Sphingomonas sp.]